jgi:MFS transporter, DHA1 family, inner membrane transport protein
VFAVLPDVAPPPALRLRQRLTPLGDARVATTLLTTLLFMFGVFLVYTYVSVVFDRATGGDGILLAVLLSIWGIAATIGNLAAGSLSDRFGSRLVINVALFVVALDFALMPWVDGFIGAAFAIAAWGFCGWGFVVSQQHRLISIDAALAPILLALNASAIYLAISASGAVGALVMRIIDPHELPLMTGVLVIASLFCAELSYRQMRRNRTATEAPAHA